MYLQHSVLKKLKTLKENVLLTDRMAPVRAPLVIEFQGSSFLRIYTREQSIAENKPPHTAKFPAEHKVNIVIMYCADGQSILHHLSIFYTAYQALGPELIPVYGQLACRLLFKSSQW